MPDIDLKNLLNKPREDAQPEQPKVEEMPPIVFPDTHDDQADRLVAGILSGDIRLPEGVSIADLVMNENIAANVADMLDPEWRDRAALERQMGAMNDLLIAPKVAPATDDFLSEQVDQMSDNLEAAGTAQMVVGNIESLLQALDLLQADHGRLHVTQVGIVVQLDRT